MSRLINNQIWNARSFTNLSVEDKLLFLYLETSPETNYYGVFVLPSDQIISARTGLTLQKVKNSLDELQKSGKILLVGDYLIIFDYFDRQKNNESEKTKKGLENFEKSLPLDVYESWIKGRPSPLDTPLIPPSSPLEEKKVKESKDKLNETKENADHILEFYNKTFNKNLKSTVWDKNLDYWLQTYSLDDIKKAIGNLQNPNWWPNQKNLNPGLELLFRVRNTKGEACDYIQQLLDLTGHKPAQNYNSSYPPVDIYQYDGESTDDFQERAKQRQLDNPDKRYNLHYTETAMANDKFLGMKQNLVNKMKT